MNAGAADWVRYWRPARLPVEVMHAHFTEHIYHRHSHETYSFGVTESGAQAFRCRNDRYVSTTGLVMAFNPDDPHDGHSASPGGFTYRMVHIDPAAFGGGPLPLYREPVLHDPLAAAALRGLIGAVAGGSGELVQHERLEDAVAVLRLHAAAGTWRPPGAVPAGAARIAARVRSLLHDTGHADPGMDELAQAAGCSRYAAYRAFTAVYGMAPSDYQRQLRIRRARTLLTAGVRPADVAAEAGFADQAHLTRWFRRCYGITPAAYAAAVTS